MDRRSLDEVARELLGRPLTNDEAVFVANACTSMGLGEGDILVVGVDSDAKIRRRKGEDRPMVPENERLELLAHQRPVDLIYLKDDSDPTWGLIKAVEPDVLVLTADHSYSPEQLTELREVVGEIEVIERQASVTTSERIRQMYMNLGDKLGPKLAEVLPGLIDETLRRG